MALVGNEDISVSISNTFLHTYGLVSDLQQFLGRSSVPLDNIQGIIIDAASDAKVGGSCVGKRDCLTV